MRICNSIVKSQACNLCDEIRVLLATIGLSDEVIERRALWGLGPAVTIYGTQPRRGKCSGRSVSLEGRRLERETRRKKIIS